MKKTIFFALALALLAAPPAFAKPEKYVLDPSHTQVLFSIGHLGISTSHGRFNKTSGGFTFDQDVPQTSTVSVVIDTDSIDMGSDAWDTHLKSADFFNVQQFQTMAFKSTEIIRTKEKEGTLKGDLTLLGVTKPVTLNVVFNGTTTHPMNKNQMAGFSATGTLKRSDFGMNYGLPMVGDDVNLTISVEGIRQDFEKLP